MTEATQHARTKSIENKLSKDLIRVNLSVTGLVSVPEEGLQNLTLSAFRYFLKITVFVQGSSFLCPRWQTTALKDPSLGPTAFFFSFFFYFYLFIFLILKSLILTCVPKHESPSHLPPHNISLGHPHAPAPSMLYPTSDIDWRFDSYMIVYMLECHSPKSSHPLPLPLSPKVHYTQLCLFSCLAYRVVIAIFLNSIYMC